MEEKALESTKVKNNNYLPFQTKARPMSESL